MYSMDLRHNTKTFFVKVGGFFKEDEAARYINDFQTNLSKIKPAEYKLVVDAQDQTAVLKHVIDDLKNALKFYDSCGFKQVAIVLPTSATSRVQVKKCAKEINFKGKLVPTVEEALKL